MMTDAAGGMDAHAVTESAAPGVPPPLPGIVRFLGDEPSYWQLRIRGAALLLVTLGLYRFWLMTDVRRFLWSNLEIDGETLEYSGLATELLVGFLFAIAILIPVYVAIAMASLTLGLDEQISALIGLALLALFGEFARYRARRYRLTRTILRGVRFNQRGSAWLYALYALVWWGLVFLSFGLAYPWAQANLQRFMMRHTSYGDVPGRFEGSGWVLFVRGLPLWLLCVAPVIVAAAVLATAIDWHALAGGIPQDVLNDQARFNSLAETFVRRVGVKLLLGTILGGIGGSMLAAVLVYPLFQAIVYRWWLSGLRFGSVAVTSRLRIGRVYGIYGRFVGYMFLFMLGASIGTSLFAAVVVYLLKSSHAPGREWIATLLPVAIYAIFALGISVIHQVVIILGLWRAAAQSAEISAPRALETVHATAARSSALGEGLADALGFGNF